MKHEQDRVKALLVDTITLLCKNGLTFYSDLKVQGLIGITVDDRDVFVVHINEVYESETGGGGGGMDQRQSFNTRLPTTRPSPHISAITSSHLTAQLPLFRARNHPSFQTSSSSSSSKTFPFSRKRHRVSSVAQPPSFSQSQRNVAARQPLNDSNNTVANDTTTTTSDVGTSGVVAGSAFMKIETQDTSDETTGEARLASDNADEAEDRKDTVTLIDSDNDDVIETKTKQFTPNEGDRDSDDAGIMLREEGSVGNTSPHRLASTSHVRTDWSKPSRRSRTANRFVSSTLKSEQPSRLSGGADGYGGDGMMGEGAGGRGMYVGGGGVGDGKWDVADFDNREDSFLDQSLGDESVPGGLSCQYPDCGRVFNYKRSLDRHQRMKHGAIFGATGQLCFFCTIPDCGRVFYKDFNLHKHQRDIHGMTVIN